MMKGFIRSARPVRYPCEGTMDLGPLFKSYVLFSNGAGCLLNLFLVGFFLYAHRRYRNQPAFLVFAFGCFCAAFTTAYLFASGIQRQYSIDVFPYPIWRILAYAFFVADPLVFISTLIGPIVLVLTYGRNHSQSRDGHK
jgi:hypothetical protein